MILQPLRQIPSDFLHPRLDKRLLPTLQARHILRVLRRHAYMTHDPAIRLAKRAEPDHEECNEPRRSSLQVTRHLGSSCTNPPASLEYSPVAALWTCSSPPTLKLWVKPVELDSRVGGGELPADDRGLTTTLNVPGVQFTPQARFVGDSAVQALPRKNAQFDFGDVEPTAVARGVNDLQPRGQSMSLGGGEGRVQRGDVVGVEVVANHPDLRGGGKVDGEQLLDLASPILAGALRAAGGPPPAQERGEEHEDRRGAVAFVLVILAQRRAGRHGQRQAELAVEFLAGLVHDDQRDIVVFWERVDVKDTFHLRDEPGRVAFGNTEPLGPPGLKLVFLSVLRTVSRPMLTMSLRLTNSSASMFIVQNRRPSGAGVQQIATRCASRAPSILAGTGGAARTLRSSAAFWP